MFRQSIILFVLLSLGVFVADSRVFLYQKEQETLAPLFFRVVLAEDDDEEEEDEDEDEDEDKRKVKDTDDERSSSKIKIKESVVTTYRLVEKTVTILDEKFRVDTDGDLLVDGLDPHPTVPEAEYFTDDDEDAIPNALDVYPGEDDFFVFDDEDDGNKDGLLDSFVDTFRKEEK